jgi:hypothetical protein
MAMQNYTYHKKEGMYTGVDRKDKRRGGDITYINKHERTKCICDKKTTLKTTAKTGAIFHLCDSHTRGTISTSEMVMLHS